MTEHETKSTGQQYLNVVGNNLTQDIGSENITFEN